MDPFTMMAIGAGVQTLSGLVGYLVESGREEEAREIMERARREYDNLSVPRMQEIAAEVLGPTELSKIQTDPAYRAAQNDSLDKLRQMEEGGGFNLEDRAALNRIQNQLARNEAASRAGITEQMQARGIGGSGAELAMQLGNSQAGADRAQQAGLDVAAQAQRRYFDAIRGRADMAGRLRQQDWGEQAQAAAAQDAINRFNLGHRVDVARYNNDMRQQQYQNQLALADRRYGLARDRAAEVRGRGERDGQVIGGVGNAVGGGMQRWGAWSAYQQPQAGATQYGADYPDMQPATSLNPNDEKKR